MEVSFFVVSLYQQIKTTTITNKEKIYDFRYTMIEEIKMNVKSIFTKLYGEIEEDESCVLNFSDITNKKIVVYMEDVWQDCYTKVTLDTIVVTEEDVYMTGLTECGDIVEEIYFDSIDTDMVASIADAICEKNDKL